MSYLGIVIEHSGLATSHDCGINRNSLNLVLAGSDPQAIAAELHSYMKLLRLPQRTKVMIFRGSLLRARGVRNPIMKDR